MTDLAEFFFSRGRGPIQNRAMSCDFLTKIMETFWAIDVSINLSPGTESKKKQKPGCKSKLIPLDC